MSSTTGYYYLHTNGDLIYKPAVVLEWDASYFDSDFVRKVWPVDVENRGTAWTLILEALAMGADRSRVLELIEKWQCDSEDLTQFMVRMPTPSKLMQEGIVIYLREVAEVDPDLWFDWLAATPKGSEPNFATMPKKDIN